MPYIKTNIRNRLDSTLEYLIEDTKTEGELNYAITRLCDGFLPEDVHYSDLNAIIGVLECAKLEFYRRVVAPFENNKRKENGDVYGVDDESESL